MKRLGRDSAELTALRPPHRARHSPGDARRAADQNLRPDRHRTHPVRVLRGHGREERENIRETTLEGLNAAARKGNHGGRPPVITNDMLHTVLRRRANGESIEDIRQDLITPTGKRKGRNPSLASIYRALAEHDKHQRYPDAIDQAHAKFTADQANA
jgi:hypothetical protein